MFVHISCSAFQIKVVLRVPAMMDEKSKQKAIEAVADVYGNHNELTNQSVH